MINRSCPTRSARDDWSMATRNEHSFNNFFRAKLLLRRLESAQPSVMCVQTIGHDGVYFPEHTDGSVPWKQSHWLSRRQSSTTAQNDGSPTHTQRIFADMLMTFSMAKAIGWPALRENTTSISTKWLALFVCVCVCFRGLCLFGCLSMSSHVRMGLSFGRICGGANRRGLRNRQIA